ncbi:hypothetical protein RHIZO_03982 [Rhizobiaceae bacterium]|nr:hypothetical protein RHIZO_03982 [Rhizobiaceae bacterium]
MRRGSTRDDMPAARRARPEGRAVAPRRRFVAHAIALVAALLAAPLPAQAPAAADAPQLSGPALLAALRAGGVTLYFRHTATDFSQSDERFVAGDCATQRNLTDEGRRDARAIGDALRRLGIPVGEVLASPWCRTMETARLMLGRATPSAAVRGGPAQADAGRYDELRALLATPPAAGNVRVIASHGNPFRAVAGPPYLAEGEAAVVAPAPGGFAVVARVRKGDWPALGD